MQALWLGYRATVIRRKQIQNNNKTIVTLIVEHALNNYNVERRKMYKVRRSCFFVLNLNNVPFHHEI